MAEAGVLLESPADIEAAFPKLAPSRKMAHQLGDLTLTLTSIESLLIDVRVNVATFEYKRASRRPPAKAFVLPNGPADLRTWLEERLGPIEWVRKSDLSPSVETEGGMASREEETHATASFDPPSPLWREDRDHGAEPVAGHSEEEGPDG
jgi:hypothetical protein